jgi:hypothetical protein
MANGTTATGPQKLSRHVRPPRDGAPPLNGAREGWVGRMVAGNFNIFSLDWWFSEDVQDFVHLVLRTGAHIEHRWVGV